MSVIGKSCDAHGLFDCTECGAYVVASPRPTLRRRCFPVCIDTVDTPWGTVACTTCGHDFGPPRPFSRPNPFGGDPALLAAEIEHGARGATYLDSLSDADLGLLAESIAIERELADECVTVIEIEPGRTSVQIVRGEDGTFGEG